MPITREFEFDCTEYPGLRPVGMAEGDAASGRVVAHDILEHFSFDGPAIENELLALGALFYLRYETGAQSPSNVSREVAFANNIADVLRDYLENPSLDLPRAKRVHNLNELPDRAMRDAVLRAYARVQAELHERSFNAADFANLKSAQAAVLGWVLTGYKRAVARYARADAYTVASTLFATIVKKVDTLLRSEVLEQGARVRISANARDGYSVNLRVSFPGHTHWVNADQLC